MKKLLIAALLAPLAALANTGGLKLDRAPVDTHDTVSLQRGAQVFVNYCLNCHSAAYMRYNRLKDLALSDAQIKDNLLFAGEKVGDLMTIAMRTKDAKEWFGAAPPDLTVIARSRGADWLYTYLRTFYRDESRPTGWNNLAFENVGMPHVLYQLQGMQGVKVEEKPDGHGGTEKVKTLVQLSPGTMTKFEYDRMVGDLVNYLVYMGEPARNTRIQVGIWTLMFLSLLAVFAWLLKREFWKDVH